jgi:hypothetical protein
MSVDAAVKDNAAQVVAMCQPLAGFPFGYDERSVQWLEGHIERLRERGAFAREFDEHVALFGSYLGEAIIASFGGRWEESEEHPLHIALVGGATAFPFVKVAKQMQNGLADGDSIAGFFRAVPRFLEQSRTAT